MGFGDQIFRQKKITNKMTMNAEHILNQTLSIVTPDMHKVRKNTLKCLINSLFNGASLTVTSLGRYVDSDSAEKHQIKRSDRFLRNRHIQSALPEIYTQLTRQIIGTKKRPIILVDWSDLDDRKQNFLIRASVAVKGRALTLYEEVHPLARREKAKTHKCFMQTLKGMLPSDCVPIIVTDAGFKVPWFKMIESLGWDYIGRVRGTTLYCQGGEWLRTKSLHQKATSRAKLIGTYELTMTNPIIGQLVIYKSLEKGRKDKTADGQRSRQSRLSRVYAKRNTEPWLLVTSMSSSIPSFAKKITKIYSARMQIEESFRDIKTGFNMNLGNSRIIERLSVLLMIAMLAQYVLMLLGISLVLQGQSRYYQANTVRKRMVLSNQFIALRAIAKRRICLTNKELIQAKKQLSKFMESYLD